MPNHHVKGQPAASTFAREKGCFTYYTHRKTPCRITFTYTNTLQLYNVFTLRSSSIQFIPCSQCCLAL